MRFWRGRNSAQPTTTESIREVVRKELEALFEQQKLREKLESVEHELEEVKETLSKGMLVELEDIRRELGEIKTKMYEKTVEETVLNILATYGGTREWEEFKELLAYGPKILEAALKIGTESGCKPSLLLPIAAALYLKYRNKEDGKPPAEIEEKYNIDPAAVKKYLIELSNQSPEASTIISSYMEK